jgi:tRNA G46 methylase TrmB
VGCFDAAFLYRLAAKNPTSAFVGLDWKARAIFDGAQRIVDQKLNNVALLHGRASDLLGALGSRTVDQLLVFHPDPCDREAELKNRLIAPAFMAQAHELLRDSSSRLFLKTDHPGYFQWTLSLLNLAPSESFFTNPKLRSKDVMQTDQLPGPSRDILDQWTVHALSENFWADADIQSQITHRCFSREQTPFEQRFTGKRQPIYFVELGMP